MPEQNLLTLAGTLDPAIPVTELILPDGRTVRLDTLLLLGANESAASFSPSETTLPQGTEQVIPLIEEQLLVGKQTVETGKVRLIKSVQEHQQTLDEPLAVRTFDIERIILNHPVDAAPGIRHEGDVTIYPVVEEQLVLTKQLILREEIRITQRDTERRDNQVVTLRREHLLVEREDLTK